MPSAIKIYPRACGGTLANALHMSPGRGLSPRLRGNRADADGVHRGGWSIPAPVSTPTEKRPGIADGDLTHQVLVLPAADLELTHPVATAQRLRQWPIGQRLCQSE